MKIRTFWACAGCDRNYTSQRWGLKHLVTAHDGAAHLDEFSPEFQRRLIEQARERANSLRQMKARWAARI